MQIIVNGRDIQINAKQGDITSYEIIADLANKQGILTVTYSGQRAGDGSLAPMQKVEIEEGMIFNVADTRNA